MSVNPPPTRFSTTARVRCFNTRCAIASSNSAGRRSRSSTRIRAARRPLGLVRAGFERMVAEVCRVRSARWRPGKSPVSRATAATGSSSCRMCRVVDTLLIDQETIYAPRQGNDRLMLGLKGSLNEYQLDLLRQRSLAARYEKARRGELVVAAPVGFIKVGDRLEQHPTGACRRRSASPSTRSRNSAACGRRCSGFWSTSSSCRPGSMPARSNGAARATPRYTSSSPTPPMGARTLMAAPASWRAMTGPEPRRGRGASRARPGQARSAPCPPARRTMRNQTSAPNSRQSQF